MTADTHDNGWYPSPGHLTGKRVFFELLWRDGLILAAVEAGSALKAYYPSYFTFESATPKCIHGGAWFTEADAKAWCERQTGYSSEAQ